MPIYAYKCSSCGMSTDILRKISDPALTLCPACGANALAKQVTAAGFQLKGSGWYVTDFREGQKSTAPQGVADASQTTSDKPSEASSPASADTSGLAATTPKPAPASSPAPAASTSTSASGTST